MTRLPNNWSAVPIRSLMQLLVDGKLVHQGWSPQCESGPAVSARDWGALKTTAIQDGEYLPEHNKKLPNSLEAKARLEVKAGDLLMTCAGPRARCGIACLVRNTPPQRFISGKMYRFRANETLIDPRLLEAFLRAPSTKIQIDAMKTGISESGMNITHEKFAQLVVPIAPRHEQKRIADKLDTVLTRVDAVNTRLARVAPLLKRFRQSVLAAATSGLLTEGWRIEKEMQDIWPESRQPLKGFVSLDVGFAFKSADFSDRGIRLLRGDNIEPGALRWRNAKCLPLDDVQPKRHIELAAGDVVLAMDRPLVSSGLKVARVVSDDLPCLLVQRVCRFRPSKDLQADYLYVALQSQAFVSHLGNVQNGSSIPHISGGQILSFAIPLPSLEEQAEIVRRVDTLFTFADRLEVRLQAAQTATERLTPALLAKAFRGELVPQDPNDEPASELLKRLAASASTVPARGRRKAAGGTP